MVDRCRSELQPVHRLREAVGPLTIAHERVLPVLPALETVLPGGLPRGSTLAVGGDAASSAACCLLAGAARSGAWAAVVGLPAFGLAAARSLGVPLDRLVLLAEPEAGRWAQVVAALLEGFPLVLVGPRHPVRPAHARRLAARVRERGAVLVHLHLAGSRAWPEPVDLELRTRVVRWLGLEEGHGHLTARQVQVEVRGRRGATRPRQTELWLPDPDGGVEPVEPVEPVERVEPVGSVTPADQASPAAPPESPEMAQAG